MPLPALATIKARALAALAAARSFVVAKAPGVEAGLVAAVRWAGPRLLTLAQKLVAFLGPDGAAIRNSINLSEAIKVLKTLLAMGFASQTLTLVIPGLESILAISSPLGQALAALTLAFEVFRRLRQGHATVTATPDAARGTAITVTPINNPLTVVVAQPAATPVAVAPVTTTPTPA